tara:strand:+ start:87 stop:458 length:372 start_codon:yes stop_codon:yes gene_type:complete
MTVVSKLCLECDQPLFGRVDKKFCNDQCRNAYNNRVNKTTNDFVRNVNGILRKNRRIIASLLDGKEKSITTKEKLLLHGFNFNYFTNTYMTKQDKVYYFVYELGYLILENDQYALVVKNDYVK